MEESKSKSVGQVFAIAIALAFVIPTMITFVGMATEQSDLPTLESNNVPDTRLFLRNGDFDTSRGEPYARANYKAEYGADEEVYYIVQFNDKVTDDMKDSVRGAGAKILETEYVHENAYVVKMTGNMKGNIEKISSVQWCGLLQPGYKISDKSADWTGEHYWCVWLFKDENVQSIAAELKTIGAREVMIEEDSLTNPEKRNNPYIFCYIDMEIMPEILKIPEIAHINDRSPVPLDRSKQSSELLNAADAWDIVRSGLSVPLTGYDPVTGYQGLGITDSGIDATHLDFATGPTGISRVYNGATDGDGHGTGCAGAAAGNGWNWLSVHGEVVPGAGNPVEYDRGNAGTAPEAMINMYSTSPDAELSHDDQYFDDPIFRVFSSSSGYDPADGTYETQCAGIDAFIFDTAWDSIGCYAAANSGDAPQYPGDTPGPYGVLDPLKNGLCVAASNNDAPQNGTHTFGGYGIVEWSSRGPSDDGRIKPDIAAPGTFVHSTRSGSESDSLPYGPNEEYKWFGGTSCATPIVAGTAMLVRQYYNSIENIPSPSMSLMKATLINGADDAGHGIPSYSQGWGLVNVRNSLFPTAPRSWDYMEDISNFNDAGDEYNFNIDVLDNRVPLRISLVWADDSPGAVGGGVTILNDLDLTVTAPGGTEYHGNMFRDNWAYPNPSDSLGWEYDSDNNGYDDRNTVECVYIDVGDVEVGLYAVNVDISNFDHVSLATGGIPYSLVWSGDLGVNTQTGRAYDIGMTTDAEYLHHIKAGGVVSFPFNVYNQGQSTDDVTFSEIVSTKGIAAAGWSITFDPTSITGLLSGDSIGCVATIKAPAVPRNDYNITLFADSGGGADQEALSLMVNVIDTEIAMPEKAIVEPGNQLQADPFYVDGKIYIAYNSGERYWDGTDSSEYSGMQSAYVKMSEDGGNTWTPVGPNNGRASTPMPLPAGTDGGSDPGFFTEPNDISICARTDGDVIIAYTTSMRFWLMVSYYDAIADTWTQNLLYTVLNTDTDVEFLDQAGISGCSVGTSDGAGTDVWWVIGCILYDDLGSSPSANEELYYFTSTTGTSWTSGAQIPPATDAGQYDRQHMSTVDGTNTFWLVWRCAVTGGSDNYQRKVWYTTWDATDTTPTFDIRHDIGASADEDQDCNWPYVYAVPGTNEIWFAWYEAGPGDASDLYDVSRVRVRYTPDGGSTWSNIFGPFGTNTLMWNNYDAEEYPVGIARTTDGTIWIGYLDLYWTDGSLDPYTEAVWDWALFEGLPGAANANYRCAYTDSYDLTTFTPSYYQVTSDNYGRRQHRMVADGDTAIVFGDRTTSYDIEDEISLIHPTNPQPNAWSLSNGLSNLERDIYMYRIDNLGLADTEGPITYNIGATPNPVNQTISSTFNLTATINDVYTGNSNIQAAPPAEYSFDGVSWVSMGLADAAPTTQTEVATSTDIDTLPQLPGTPEGVDYTIYVRGYDALGNMGPTSTMILTVVAYNIPPAVTVDYPTAADIIESGTINIDWTATDFDGIDADLDIDIEYSDDSGLSWIPIITLVDDNNPPYAWTPLPADGVNYLIRVTATDEGTPAISGSDVSDTAFSIDNDLAIPGQRWHFQAFGAPEMELNMKPVENTPNDVGAQVSDASEHIIGGSGNGWLSDVIPAGGSLAGDWEFSAWGMVDRAGCTGFLKANIYEYGNPTILASATDDDNVGDDFVMTQYTWNPTIASGTLSAGGQIYIELVIDASVGLGTVTDYYYPDSDMAGGSGTVTGGFGDLDDTSPGVTEDIEEIVSIGSADSVPLTKGPLDSSGGIIGNLYTDDNVYYTVNRNARLEMETFDITGVPADLSSCTLEATFYVAGGFTASNYIEWALDGQAYADTTIQPSGSDTSEVTRTFDLFAAGVDTAAEVATLDIYYMNNDFAPGTPMFFDVLKIVCGWGDPSNIEHKWTIPVTTATETFLGVQAWRNDMGEGDSFTFSYSTDDVTYIDVFTCTATSDPGAIETLITPSVPTGTLYIKVVDDDRTSTNLLLDKLFIDQLYIKSVDPGPTFSFYYDHGDTPSYVVPYIGVTTDTAYEIPMPAGAVVGTWVFVSFAYVMTGAIEVVLADSDITSGTGTQWDIAKWYDATDANDPWKTYNKNNPVGLNDLTTIDQTMGVWLHLTATDGTLSTGTIGDYSTIPVNIDLYAGWNLVGFPTENNEFANAALGGTGATWIATWQLAEPFLADTTDLPNTPMVEGEAYWVYVGTDTTWIVDPL